MVLPNGAGLDITGFPGPIGSNDEYSHDNDIEDMGERDTTAMDSMDGLLGFPSGNGYSAGP